MYAGWGLSCQRAYHINQGPKFSLSFDFAILFGAFSFIIYPLALSHANDFADATQFVGVTAGLLLSYSLGAIAGPALAALAMQLLSPLALFYFTEQLHCLEPYSRCGECAMGLAATNQVSGFVHRSR